VHGHVSVCGRMSFVLHGVCLWLSVLLGVWMDVVG
jgi:hypothetical protein